MRPLTLQEFGQQLRLEGHPFADEILDLIDIETEVAEPFSDLCGDLDHYAEGKGTPAKQMEWLGDRSQLLAEIEEQFENAARGVKDVDDAVKEVLGTLEQAEALLMQSQWLSEGGDFLTALETVLGKTRPQQEYDL